MASLQTPAHGGDNAEVGSPKHGVGYHTRQCRHDAVAIAAVAGQGRNPSPNPNPNPNPNPDGKVGTADAEKDAEKAWPEILCILLNVLQVSPIRVRG